ncbi:MAG: hypothetical protein JW996_07605, partial [Candidatus Cloacimonetes bacterium]|nr:hypothetical protein [Candidatus Cloacimonadota bacterium]
KSVKDKHYKAKDRVLYYLDLGMLYYYNQEPEISNETLSKAEIGIDENYTKSISKAAVSFLLNDNALDYAGEDYEDIYLNIFKSLNYLTLGSFDGAFVEIRRINNKLDGLEDKYKKMAESYQNTENNKAKFTTAENRFHNDALGRYLSMLIYRAEGKLDDARIDSNKLSDAWTQQSHIYNFPKPDLSNFLEPTDKARLNIIGFCGKSPVKKAKTLYIHTEKNLIIVATTERKPEGETTVGFLNALPWEGVQKGYHFKFQLPFIEEVNSNVGSIRVVVNESQSVELSLLEDFGKVAVETFKLKEPLIYTKTIARTVIKGLFAEKRKEEMEKKIANPLLGLAARLATDAAVDATENADLRISRFFPDQARIAEILVEPGCHQLKIEYYSKNGTLLFVDDFGMIDVKKNDLNLIKSCYLN